MTELLVLVLLAVAGWLVLGPDRGPAWRVAAAVPVGTALVVVLELLLLATGLPIAHPVVALVGATVVAAVVALRAGGWLPRPVDRRPLLIGTAVLVAVWVLTAVVPLVNVTSDSFRYLVTAGLLERSGDTSMISPFQLQKRVLTVGALHALAPDDPGYLRALTPLLAAATVGMTVLAVREATARVEHGLRWFVAVGAGLLLVSNHRFVFNATYLNGHAPFAAWLLVIAVLSWRVLRSPAMADLRTAAVIVVAASAVVVTRPEGAVVIVTALLPVAVAAGLPRWWRATVIGGTGVAATLWHVGVLVRVTLERDRDLERSVLGLAALALALVVAAALLRVVDRIVALVGRGHPLVVAHALAWAAVVVLTVLRPGTTRSTVVATLRNVSHDGFWGISLLVLAALLVVVLPRVRVVGEEAWLFPLLTFVPLSVLLAFARGAPWRIGPGDSLNRMLLHVLPLAVLALAATAGGHWRRDDGSEDAPGLVPAPSTASPAAGGAGHRR